MTYPDQVRVVSVEHVFDWIQSARNTEHAVADKKMPVRVRDSCDSCSRVEFYCRSRIYAKFGEGSDVPGMFGYFCEVGGPTGFLRFGWNE